MNRLIVIGNGFDLAHNMRTSYKDFIFSYLKESFIIAMNGVYDDDLMTIRRRQHIRIPDLKNINELDVFMQFLSPQKRAFHVLSLEEDYNDQPDLGFSWEIKNEFIEHVFTQCHKCNWVDIENEYYAELLKVLELKSEDLKRSAIKNLNSSFESLKNHLETYLSKLPEPNVDQKYNKYFFENIKTDEIVIESIKQGFPNKTLVLNFNYTSTIEHYFKGNALAEINYIHGKLSDRSNPIIFGFGDELDKEYMRLESDKIKGILHYIKSFWYFRTSNYHNLTRFIDADKFQVQIFGHSCGLSDRTMLNMIFEHANCLSIKIFYHEFNNKNNYTPLTEEISRHFQNKGIMRKKIVPFDKSFPMPQTDS